MNDVDPMKGGKGAVHEESPGVVFKLRKRLGRYGRDLEGDIGRRQSDGLTADQITVVADFGRSKDMFRAAVEMRCRLLVKVQIKAGSPIAKCSGQPGKEIVFRGRNPKIVNDLVVGQKNR